MCCRSIVAWRSIRLIGSGSGLYKRVYKRVYFRLSPDHFQWLRPASGYVYWPISPKKARTNWKHQPFCLMDLHCNVCSCKLTQYNTRVPSLGNIRHCNIREEVRNCVTESIQFEGVCVSFSKLVYSAFRMKGFEWQTESQTWRSSQSSSYQNSCDGKSAWT